MKQRGATPEEDRAHGWIEEGIITKVEPYGDSKGWSVIYGDSMGCGVRDTGLAPKVGDTLTVFGQFGHSFHGQAINGQVIWYLSRAEEEAERQAWLAKRKSDQCAKFEESKERLDRDYDWLPPLFKMRIDRFRAANADFRWQSESYEMFVCTQAVVLADWARSQVDDTQPGWKDEAVAKIDAWDKINSADNDPPYAYKAQIAAVPGWEDGHSGNTHGCAVFLAKEYLTASERVVLQPGALAPLVGTTDYSKT